MGWAVVPLLSSLPCHAPPVLDDLERRLHRRPPTARAAPGDVGRVVGHGAVGLLSLLSSQRQYRFGPQSASPPSRSGSSGHCSAYVRSSAHLVAVGSWGQNGALRFVWTSAATAETSLCSLRACRPEILCPPPTNRQAGNASAECPEGLKEDYNSQSAARVDA